MVDWLIDWLIINNSPAKFCSCCAVQNNWKGASTRITCDQPGVSNRWISMIGKPIDQSRKLVNWYPLVSVNRWSIDNLTKVVHWHRLAEDLETDVLSSSIFRQPWGLVKQFRPSLLSAKKISRCTCTRITHLLCFSICWETYTENHLSSPTGKVNLSKTSLLELNSKGRRLVTSRNSRGRVKPINSHIVPIYLSDWYW